MYSADTALQTNGMVIHETSKRFHPTMFGKRTYLKISTQKQDENLNHVDSGQEAEKTR